MLTKPSISWGVLLLTSSRFQRLPRFVTIDWIEQSWHEKTLLDEQRTSPLKQTDFYLLLSCDEVLTVLTGFAPT